jgi:hypothetical protein
MTTRGAMITRIEDEIDDEDLTSQVGLAIDSAIKHHERTPFYFNQKIVTFNTVAAQEYYTSADAADIPTLIHVRRMSAASSSLYQPVLPAEFANIDALQDGGVTGFPCHFTMWEQKLRLYPIPDGVYPVKAPAIYRLAAVTDPLLGNAWYQDAEELIRQRAKYLLHMDVTKDRAAAGDAATLEADALKALKKETRLRMPDAELSLAHLPVVSQPFDIRTG